MTLWLVLLDLLILLSAATALGAVCERIGLTPLFGYLVAGTLLGPNAFDLLPSHAAVASITELGVALLEQTQHPFTGRGCLVVGDHRLSSQLGHGDARRVGVEQRAAARHEAERQPERSSAQSVRHVRPTAPS